MSFDVASIAVTVGDALSRCGVDHFVGGSVASSIQGHPRSTQDIDFVVHLRPEQVETLKLELGADFEVDEVALEEAARARTSWNIFHLPSLTRIDLFILRDAEYDVEELARRRQVEVQPGRMLWVKTPEDTVLRKLKWYRDGGESSSRQLRDVVDVLRVQGVSLDETYLDRWASKLGIVDLLTVARAQARS